MANRQGNADLSIGGVEAASLQNAEGLSLAIILGAVAAAIGGAIWAGAAFLTGYELGLAAWAIGFLVGWVVRTAAERPGVAGGASAALLALCGLVLGKLLIAQFMAAPQLHREYMADESKMRGIVLSYMIGTDKFTAAEVDTLNATLAKGKPAPDAMMERIEAYYDSLTPEQRERAVAGFAQQIADKHTWAEKIQLQLSVYDILWVLLVGGTAFLLANTRE